jgi:hypothetical protein
MSQAMIDVLALYAKELSEVTSFLTRLLFKSGQNEGR